MGEIVKAGTKQRSTGSTNLGGGTHLKIPGPHVAGVVKTNQKYSDPMRLSGDANLAIPRPSKGVGVVRTNQKYSDPMRLSSDANLTIPRPGTAAVW